jgi:hypothetical protein
MQDDCGLVHDKVFTSKGTRTALCATKTLNGCPLGGRSQRRENMSIFTILFAVLVIAWLLGLTVFHVAGGLIHILLVLAVVALVLHFIRGGSARTA